MTLADKVAVNATAQLAGQVVNGVGGILAVALSARYLGLDAFGQFLTALVFVSMFNLVTDFGLPTAGALEMSRSPARRKSTMTALLLLASGLTGLAIAGIWLGSTLIYSGAAHAITREALLVLILPLALNPLKCVAQARAITDQKLYVSALAGIGARLFSLISVLVVVVFDLGPMALAAAYGSYPLLSTLGLAAALRRSLDFEWRVDIAMMRHVFSIAAPLGGVVVLDYLYFRLDLFLLSVLASHEAVAVYGLAYKLIEALISLPYFVMVTLVPEMSKARPQSPMLFTLVQSAFAAMQLVALPVIVLGLYSGDLLTVLGGVEYERGALALGLLLGALGVSFLQQVLGNALVAQGKQRKLFWRSGAVLMFNACLNLVLIPRFGLEGAAVSVLLTEVLSLITVLFMYRSIGRLPRLHAPVRSLAAGVLMLAVMAIRFVPGAALPSPTATVILWGTAGLGAYVLTLHLLGAVPDYVSRLVSRPVAAAFGRAKETVT